MLFTRRHKAALHDRLHELEAAARHAGDRAARAEASLAVTEARVKTLAGEKDALEARAKVVSEQHDMERRAHAKRSTANRVIAAGSTVGLVLRVIVVGTAIGVAVAELSLGGGAAYAVYRALRHEAEQSAVGRFTHLLRSLLK